MTKELFGIINVNKPKGFTSHDVVAKLRKILKIKQIGHTGTLDPMATGVLPVCIGKATKIIQYMESSKAYMAFIKLGVKTDTYDMEGKILEQNPVIIAEDNENTQTENNYSIENIKSHLQCFYGEITQIPPIYSAVHYKGKRLYEYARKNIEISDIPTRKVNINAIELINIQKNDSDNPVLLVCIDCSGGTYIRSIAHDLGKNLGCGACLSGLVRTKAGNFLYETAKTLEEIELLANSGKFEELLVNPVNVLPINTVEVREELLGKIKNGQSFFTDLVSPPHTSLSALADVNTSIVQLVHNDKLVGIANIENNKIKPVNVFI